MVPSPESVCNRKFTPSVVPVTPAPDPLTVNVPLEKLALPVCPTVPKSTSSHEGSGWVATNKRKALLSFMLGATDTTTGPEVAPVGMVTVIDVPLQEVAAIAEPLDRKSTRLNSSHTVISYA